MKSPNRIVLFFASIIVLTLSYFLDDKINNLFQSPKNIYLSLLFSVITNIGVLIVVMIVIPSIMARGKRKKAIVMLVASFLASFVLSFVIKVLIVRPRPNFADYPVMHALDYSFPSMHAMMAFSLLPVLISSFPRQKIFWIVFAFLVAFSRIYLGFHYLSDVIFGAFCGLLIGSITLYFGKNASK